VIQVATAGQRLFASKGLLAPLDDYIGKDHAAIDEYYADMAHSRPGQLSHLPCRAWDG
jgi:hypothetical protein